MGTKHFGDIQEKHQSRSQAWALGPTHLALALTRNTSDVWRNDCLRVTTSEYITDCQPYIMLTLPRNWVTCFVELGGKIYGPICITEPDDQAKRYWLLGEGEGQVKWWCWPGGSSLFRKHNAVFGRPPRFPPEETDTANLLFRSRR